jgi:hypothetical protein
MLKKFPCALGEISVEKAGRKEKRLSIWDYRPLQGCPLKECCMDTSTPSNSTAETYIEIENRIFDKYLPQIGVYGFAVYLAVQRYLQHTPTSDPLSYATIARKLGMDRGAVIRHVKKLQRLKLLSPALHFLEEVKAKRRDRR